MAEITSTPTGSPCGKVSLGADPSGGPAVDIDRNTNAPAGADVGHTGGMVRRTDRRVNRSANARLLPDAGAVGSLRTTQGCSMLPVFTIVVAW